MVQEALLGSLPGIAQGPPTGPTCPKESLLLDLGERDEFAGAFCEMQLLNDDQDKSGGFTQGAAGHALTGKVGEVLNPFLGKWAGAVASQRARALEQPVEQCRT